MRATLARMAQYVLINPVGTRFAGEVLDSVQDGQEVINQLAAFGGVLVPLPNALLQPYIDRCQKLIRVGNYDEAAAMMQAAYASSTAISGGGTAGTIPIWSSASGLANSAISEVAGSIQTLAITNAGAGATNGSYSRQVLTGGTGTGATADIVVSGGAVIGLFLRNPGTGYTAGNTLSCATIGGAGFVFTVSSVSVSDNASGNLSGVRIGAGTNTPQSAMYARGMVYSARPEIFENGLTPAFPLIAAANVVASTIEESGGVYTLPSSISTYFPIQSVPRISLANATASQTVIGVYSLPIVESASPVGSTFVTAGRMWARIDSPSVVGAYSMTGCNNSSIINTSAAGSTVSTFTGTFSQVSVSSTNALAITDTTIYMSAAYFAGAAHNIATFYWLRLRAATLNNGSTITNYWGISQEDSLARTRHYGNLGVGNALDVGAGKVIGSLTLTNGGTGYTNGTYAQVALTTVTGTGSGATADIVVAGNIVTTVVLRAPGQGYAVGDTLSCASIGAGSNFLLTVASTASILRSDGTAVASRVGAGTATPRAGLDVAAGGGVITGVTRLAFTFASGGINAIETYLALVGTVAPTATNYGLIIAPQFDLAAGTINNPTLRGVHATPVALTSTAGTTQIVGVTGGNFEATRTYAADLSTNTSNVVRGVSGAATINASVGAASTAFAQCFSGTYTNAAAAHTVTDAFGYRALFSNAGTTTTFTAFGLSTALLTNSGTITTLYGLRLETPTNTGTITNRWGVSQEDAAANNVLAGKTAIGQAAGTAATAQADLGASTTAAASLRIRTGVAPTTPNDGDIWFDGTALRIRIAGVTRTVTVT